MKEGGGGGEARGKQESGVLIFVGERHFYCVNSIHAKGEVVREG